jgi:uroporphyrinogen-III synthase
MTFLIVRPTGKAEQTLAVFRESGLQAQALPIVDIEISDDKTLIKQLHSTDVNCIILTSTFAVTWLLRLIETKQVSFKLTNIDFICVGAGCAEMLAQLVNKTHIYTASPENSEGVLQVPCLQDVDSKHIVLLKGDGGRDLIKTTLMQRNAYVNTINVYKRVANLDAIRGFTFEPSEIRCIIVTSIEITELLLRNASHIWLLSCIWIVASERIKDYAYKNGIRDIVVSQGASSKALLACANQIVKTGAVHD